MIQIRADAMSLGLTIDRSTAKLTSTAERTTNAAIAANRSRVLSSTLRSFPATAST
jgi:hypothetical protein